MRKLRLFCLYFDNTLSLNLAHMYVNIVQILQRFFNNKSLCATHNQCGSATKRPQASLCCPWGSPPAGLRIQTRRTQSKTNAPGAGAKSTWDQGSKDAREACVEDADTITVWGLVDYDVALDATVIKI